MNDYHITLTANVHGDDEGDGSGIMKEFVTAIDYRYVTAGQHNFIEFIDQQESRVAMFDAAIVVSVVRHEPMEGMEA